MKKKIPDHTCICCYGEITGNVYYKVDNEYFPERYVKVCPECIKKVKTPKEFIHKVEIVNENN